MDALKYPKYVPVEKRNAASQRRILRLTLGVQIPDEEKKLT